MLEQGPYHEQSAENGNNTEETQNGPPPIPPTIGTTSETRKNIIHRSNEAERK
jgi:hypothetical protein